MPVGYMGRSGASMANYFASKSEDEQKIPPIPDGVNPLDAIDPATRDSIVNWDSAPVDDAPREKTFGDRVVAGLMGAGVGAVIGFLALNGLGRGMYRRAWSAKPMNAQASLVWAGIGAAIGGISGFARGRSPIDQEPSERVAQVLGGPALLGTPPVATSGASHPAFAALHGG